MKQVGIIEIGPEIKKIVSHWMNGHIESRGKSRIPAGV